MALIIGAVLLVVPALAHAASVVLEWDRNSDGLTAGYYVYYGTQSGNYSGSVDVGSSTSAVVNLNDPSATYYFAVQAYSATGEKSPLSPEIAWIQDVTSTGGTPTSGTPTSGTPAGGTSGAQAPTLSNPGSMTGTVGQSVGLQLTATDPGGLVLSYAVNGLPPGLVAVNGGFLYGIPTTAGAFNVTVTVTNTIPLSASQTFTWTILSQPGSGGLPSGGGTGGTGGTPSSGGGGTVGGVPSGGGSGTGGGSGVGGGGTTGSGGGSPAIQVPTQPAPDLTPPTVIFLSPAPVGGTARTNESRVIVTGSASDNVGVVSVTWASSRGGSGAAFGTSSWVTGPIDLSMGDNVITITVADAAGNVRTATLTVTRYVDIQNFVN
ncbi:MAG TPA: putative Ig domain-containing protein [Vicinamibacterales bacterium]|nr:putative Ig domain-containing protein [Vicinamibacterales bacterium]